MDLTKFGSADSIYNIGLKLASEKYGDLSLEANEIYDDLSNLNFTLAKYKEAKEYS